MGGDMAEWEAAGPSQQEYLGSTPTKEQFGGHRGTLTKSADRCWRMIPTGVDKDIHLSAKEKHPNSWGQVLRRRSEVVLWLSPQKNTKTRSTEKTQFHSVKKVDTYQISPQYSINGMGVKGFF